MNTIEWIWELYNLYVKEHPENVVDGKIHDRKLYVEWFKDYIGR